MGVNKQPIFDRASSRCRVPGRSTALVCALAIASAMLMAPDLYARLVFNRAQLARLHNEAQPALYERAVALAPGDDHVRWQAGAALADMGDADAAATVLLPL